MGAYNAAVAAAARAGAWRLAERREAARGPSMIRAVAYHGTPRAHRDALARQLDYLAARYTNVGEEELVAFMRGEPRAEPGVIVSFDDGLEDNYRVAAPLLEERGLRGWFFVVTGLLDCPEDSQGRFCAEHDVIIGPDAGRLGMSWDEARDLVARGHVLGCHGAGHLRYKDDVADGAIRADLSEARERMKAELGAYPRSFAWVGGEPDTYKPASAALAGELGFSFLFTTLSAPAVGARPEAAPTPYLLHRAVLDADMDYRAAALKIGLLSDLAHAGARAAVESKLRGRRG